MKVSAFFKILNKKIEKYNRLSSNPFTSPQPITLIWVEDAFQEESMDKYKGDGEQL